MEVCGTIFYSFLRKRAIGKSPLATSWPSPAPQAVGRKEVYRRSPSPPKKWGWAGRRSGGKIIFPDHYKETRCLQLPVMPNEFGVCMVYGRCCTWGAMISLQILISYEFFWPTAS